ncbi:MAG: sulfatase [Pseudomonadales bacterium]|jgi:arylsulfatase A-like enzyme
MRILYIDIDTLRADHLGCYGYHRNTSPNIDTLAASAMQFNNVHASDTPCLPSRTALLTGQFGIHNGVVNHGGTDADPVIGGPSRKFWSDLQINSFPTRLKRAGLRTVTISSFAQRHSAFHWYAGFDEAMRVPGSFGLETADEVHGLASDWLNRNGSDDNWFLHVHMWDPHTPYRSPAAFGDPFAEEAIPSWLTEEVRARDWDRCGPHSAQECSGFSPNPEGIKIFPRQPQQISDMAAVRQMFDGYDTGVLFADEYVGRLLNQLDDMGILEDTAIMLSSDHGETLGELNVYGDHQTADQKTTHIPMILKWPDTDALSGRQFAALHYQIDFSATILELLGVRVPGSWDGVSFAESLNRGEDEGRDELIVSQGAWTCQRGVRWDNWLLMQTMHDGYHLYDDVMLFDLQNDPYEQVNIASSNEQALNEGIKRLSNWHAEAMINAARGRDPLQNVIDEGGPFHVRGELAGYLKRLRETGRSILADSLEEKFASAL